MPSATVCGPSRPSAAAFLTRTHYLRGLCAFAVMVSHLGHWQAEPGTKVTEGPLLLLGTYCVSVFFCLSGFIMVNNHAHEFGQPRALPGYALKRILRIYPAYFFYSALAFVLAVVLKIPTCDPSQFGGRSASEWVAGFSLLPVGRDATAFLMVGWSLFHEVLFYVFFGGLILSRRFGLLAAGLFFGLSFVNKTGVFVPVSCLTRLNFLFLFGMAIGWAQLRIPRHAWLGWVALGAGGALFAFGMMHGWTIYHAGIAVGAALLLGGVVVLDTNAPLARGSGGWLAVVAFWLGSISYSLYLGHVPVQSVLRFVIGPPDALWRVVLYLVAPLMVAWATYCLIEKPAFRWGRQQRSAAK